MKKIINVIISLTICFTFFCACSANEETKPNPVTNALTAANTDLMTSAETPDPSVTPLLWKATDNDGHVLWLFGSIHVGNMSMSPLPKYVIDAFNKSDALAVEANVLAATQDLNAAMSAMQMLMYQDGTNISDHIAEDLYTRAKAILTEKEMYNSIFDMYKPVMWMTMLDSFLYSDADLDEDNGIDMQLLTLATDNNKEIQEIESVTAQYDMLSSFSDELQEILLESSVEVFSEDDPSSELKKLVNAWCTGDKEKLQILVSEDSNDEYYEDELKLLEEYNQEMLYNRNLLMSDFAENALTSGKEIFLCVGMAHMLNETGILNTLEARGYTVNEVK